MAKNPTIRSASAFTDSTGRTGGGQGRTGQGAYSNCPGPHARPPPPSTKGGQGNAGHNSRAHAWHPHCLPNLHRCVALQHFDGRQQRGDFVRGRRSNRPFVQQTYAWPASW
uniref:Uncharacterized protein n=1 Tax=Eutreptiella gymnastica TaxID=73025 RepID=A0A7S4LE80_9EUGL